MPKVRKSLHRSLWRILVPVVIAVGAVAGCSSSMVATTTTTSTPAAAASSSSSSSSSSALCKPDGTSLQISAHDIKFDKSCLAAPANVAFTITFKNEDSGIPHDVAIYTNSSATKALFVGALLTGPGTIVYHVPALPAGTYYFRCNVHPTEMYGTFVVG